MNKPLSALQSPQDAPTRRPGEGGSWLCQWPIGATRSPNFAYCAHAAIPGSSYCGPHTRLAYARLPARCEGIA